MDGLGGQVDARQQAGGRAGRVLVVVRVDVDQDQAGRARSHARHRGGLAVPPDGDAGGVGRSRADAVAPAAAHKAGTAVRKVSGGTGLGAAGRAVAERPLAGSRQRQDVPAERGQLERKPDRLARIRHGGLRECRGMGDACRSPTAEPRPVPDAGRQCRCGPGERVAKASPAPWAAGRGERAGPGRKRARMMSHMSQPVAGLRRWWDSAMSRVGHEGHDLPAWMGHVGHHGYMSMSHFPGLLTCGDVLVGHVGHVFSYS